LLGAVDSAIAECVAAAAQQHLPRPGGVGIASMAESGVPVDRRNLPVGDILAWHDPRPERQAAWLERQIGAQALFARTGLRPEPKYSLPKLLWIREQRAADFTRLRRWAGVAELAALTMTGNLATNASLACRTLTFNVSLRAWDAELLALASLEPENMPEVLPLGQSVGGLTEAAAKRLGLPAGTPVAIAGHDHLAAALGAGVTKPGDALDSMGSAEAALLVTAGPALTEEVRRGGFSTGCHAIDGLAYVSGGLQSSGALVEWFVDTFLAAACDGADRYAGFMELLESAVPGPVEPIVRPYLRGRTAPHRDPSASLEFEGLRETHRLPDLAAAVVDGASYHVRWMLDELARITTTPLDRVKLTGGGARNRRWVIAKAALGPGRLEVVRTEEAAALGAALVAGVAAGAYASVTDALADASPFDRCTAPATIRARYDNAYLDRWLPAVTARLRQSGLS
jgi:xylulokinase